MAEFGETKPDLDESGVDERTRRLYLGILFDCCGVYARVYRAPQDREYSGRCPRCLRKFRISVGPGGSRARFFRAE